MSIVKINAIRVPPQAAEEFEKRFAARAGAVSSSPGFEAFELMRPTDDRGQYLVYTRWESEEAFTAWREGAAFQQGHAQHKTGGPVSTDSELWEFEVIQSESAPSA